MLYGNLIILRGPNENSDRGDHFGTPFVPKTCKIRSAIKQNVGKVDFSKIPKDFLSCKGPFSHRNPVQRIGFISKFPWMVLISPNLPPGIETCRKFQPTPEKRDSLTSTQRLSEVGFVSGRITPLIRMDRPPLNRFT